MMKLSLINVLKEAIRQNDFDEEQIDPRIFQLVQDIQNWTGNGSMRIDVPDVEGYFIPYLSKKYRLNPKNSQEGGVISAVLVYMELYSPDDAFGDPESYQTVMNLLNR